MTAAHNHWGRSAAGMLVTHHGRVLMQLRAPWVHQGSTWGIPGGAIREGETAIEGALRETCEETGLRTADLILTGGRHDAGTALGWTYTTFIAQLRTDDESAPVPPPGHEALQHAWVAVAQVPSLTLHPGFVTAWPEVSALLE